MNARTDQSTKRFADVPFALAAFLGSSLIFVVQPMIAKQLLPTLGGAPAVWTTCVLFFQAVLLAGYAWAHLGPRLLGDRAHAAAHVALLVAACAFLPLGISPGWRPREDASPVMNVLAVLARSVGVPLTMLCATSPLIQRWHTALRPGGGDRVYRLYAIGNVASLVVLLAYPLAIEPTSTLRHQFFAWSVGFVSLAGLLMTIAWRRVMTVAQTFLSVSGGTPLEDFAATPRHRQECLCHWKTLSMWLVLSAVPSSLLLGVTTYLTTDVAAVPFLWVLPLAAYLGAFSLAFAGRTPGVVVRRVIAPALGIGGLLLTGAMWDQFAPPVALPTWAGTASAIALCVGTFFLLSWACLSTLYERRPCEGADVTGFYLWIAVGGVAGGAFNSIVAPQAFDTALEYPIVLALATMLSFGLGHGGRRDPAVRVAFGGLVCTVMVAAIYAGSETRVRYDVWAVGLIALFAVPALLLLAARRLPLGTAGASAIVVTCVLLLSFGGQPSRIARRSFFGIHRVGIDSVEPFLQLYHGTTLHGQQLVDIASGRTIAPEMPLMYYRRGGPLSEIFDAVGKPARIGVVGLGAGSIAAYVGPGQRLTYFEIDPIVISLADRARSSAAPFIFVSAARQRGADVSIVEGDARLTLARKSDASFDLLVLDAFSGDAIPAHLLTREAFALYGRLLTPDGTLAVHISNRYLDLSHVVAAGAVAIDAPASIGDDSAWPEVKTLPAGTASSTWVAITRDPTVRLQPPHWQRLGAPRAADAWTDDFSNLLHALK